MAREPWFDPDPRCGKTHPLGCHGHRKLHDADGKIVYGDDGKAIWERPCEAPPMKGQDVCVAHGGKAPQNRAAGEQRVAAAEFEAKARRAFGKLSDHRTPVTDPLRALQQLAGDAAAWKDFIAERIAEIEDIRTLDSRGSEQVHAMIQVWQAALRDCRGVLVDMARLNIEERVAKLDEQLGLLVADVLRAVLADPQLELSEQQKAAVTPVLHRHLAVA